MKNETYKSTSNKYRKTLLYCVVALTLILVLFMVMVTLYNFANTSQLGLMLLFKSVGVAIATDLIVSVPLLVKNYKRASAFLS